MHISKLSRPGAVHDARRLDDQGDRRPLVDAGAQPEPGRGDGARRAARRRPTSTARPRSCTSSPRAGAGCGSRTSSARSNPATARSSRQEPFTNCGTSGRTRSCSCAAAPPPTPTRTPCSSKTLDPPRLRRRARFAHADGQALVPCVLHGRGGRAGLRRAGERAHGRHRRQEGRHVLRPAVRVVGHHATRASLVGWDALSSPWQTEADSTRGWPRRTGRASTRSSRFGALAHGPPPPAHARALPVRVPPLPRALPVGEGVRHLERGQPLRRADVPPPAARRRLLPQHAPRVPGLPILAAEVLDSRTWSRGCARSAAQAGRGAAGYWGLHNYIDANRARTTGTRRMLHAVKGQVWFTETGGIVFAREPPQGHVPGVGEARGDRDALPLPTSSSR